MKELSNTEIDAVAGGGPISFPEIDIIGIDHNPNGSTTYHFSDGSQFTTTAPYNPGGGVAGGGGGGGW